MAPPRSTSASMPHGGGAQSLRATSGAARIQRALLPPSRLLPDGWDFLSSWAAGARSGYHVYLLRPQCEDEPLPPTVATYVQGLARRAAAVAPESLFRATRLPQCPSPTLRAATSSSSSPPPAAATQHVSARLFPRRPHRLATPAHPRPLLPMRAVCAVEFGAAPAFPPAPPTPSASWPAPGETLSSTPDVVPKRWSPTRFGVGLAAAALLPRSRLPTDDLVRCRRELDTFLAAPAARDITYSRRRPSELTEVQRRRAIPRRLGGPGRPAREIS